MDNSTDIMNKVNVIKKNEKVSLFAVVLDFSEPLVTNRNEYWTKIKVIDETFNKTCPL